MASRPFIPPPTQEDRLPDASAVWRDHDGTYRRPVPGNLAVSVDYGGSRIVQGRADAINWRGVVRFRFGWAPA